MIRFLFCLILAVAVWGQEPYRIGGGVSAPVPISKSEPEYTQEAKDAGIEGTVLLSTVISAEGMPTEVRVERITLREKQSGANAQNDLGLKEKAVESLTKWRFKPGMKDGKPVAVQINAEMHFAL